MRPLHERRRNLVTIMESEGERNCMTIG